MACPATPSCAKSRFRAEVAVSVRVLSSGDTALVVEFGDRIDRTLSERVLALRARVDAAGIAGVVETVPTFRSLMVHFDPLRIGTAQVRAAVETLLEGEAPLHQSRRLWRVPVCYEGDLAPDLAEVGGRTGLGAGKVAELHASVRYHVYMVGFLPGYPYMGDLPRALHLPRRADPRVRVPPGSVAIATGMTAIYPVECPGGWHLIGTTPIRIFDPGVEPPALFAPGDAVAFEAIGRAAFDRLRAAASNGEHRLVPTEIAE
jgi:KipI family sensor histidine kinase inhibitor